MRAIRSRTCRYLVGLWLVAVPVAGQSLIRVPQNDNLQGAINRISSGGVIEVSAGVYQAPGGAFRAQNLGKSFTIRGVGGEVVLDGGGVTDILRLADLPTRTLSLENLVFRGGLSTTDTFSGAVSVDSVHVVFRGCRFENNVARAPATGGGALRIDDGARVEVFGSEFLANSSTNRGGAISVLFSELDVTFSRFDGNTLTAEPHSTNAAGGGIYILDSRVGVTSSRFENNRAGWVGGAIYAFGFWRDPADGLEASEVEVRDSTFEGNIAEPLECCPVPGDVTFGGAIHVEDQTRLAIFGSRFVANTADRGGAVNSYRSIVEVTDSRFLGNFAIRDGAGDIGGAIVSSSPDVADASTDFGLTNRRPAELHVESSFFRGPDRDSETVPNQGACLFADGDLGRVVEGFGSVEENRGIVRLDRVVFTDCDADVGVVGPSFGAAIFTVLVDLEMTDSIIASSDAFGDAGAGGALGNQEDSRLVLSGSSFIANSAGAFGGALFISGADLLIEDCYFIANDVSPGVAEPVAQSPGAAMFLTPKQPAGPDIRGEVRGTTFADNVGIAIFDADFTAGPFNEVRYNDNSFRESTFGNDVYKNIADSFAGKTPNELNALVIDHTGAPDFDKSDGGNVSLSSDPRFGNLVAAPGALASSAPGDPEGGWPAVIGHAWNGGGANLAGQGLTSRGGVTEIEAAGDYPLVVDGTEFDRVSVEEASCTGGSLLCLRQNRFLLTISWRDFAGNTGAGQVVPFGTSDSGLFFFFDEDNWELLVKVIDGCGFNGHYWVFSAATTNVEYTLTVTDTFTGTSASYFNPLGVSAPAVTDTGALATCAAGDGALPPPAAAPDFGAEVEKFLAEISAADRRDVSAPREAGPKMGDCVASAADLCLEGDRFRVSVRWRDFTGNTGDGFVVQEAESSNSGLFYFFDEDNWELLIKVLNGCGFNGNYWVFSAATTNVEYTLTVTDTATGTAATYFNPLGTSAAAITDTGALPTCP